MDENEKLYVVCAACGEAFDDLDAAKNHRTIMIVIKHTIRSPQKVRHSNGH